MMMKTSEVIKNLIKKESRGHKDFLVSCYTLVNSMHCPRNVATEIIKLLEDIGFDDIAYYLTFIKNDMFEFEMNEAHKNKLGV
jgi:hypothetical protein